VFDLQKDFKFEKQIGKGAYSNVKKVTHIQSGYKVAIKTYEK
jgi:serine/threonine protein kinase